MKEENHTGAISICPKPLPLDKSLILPMIHLILPFYIVNTLLFYLKGGKTYILLSEGRDTLILFLAADLFLKHNAVLSPIPPVQT